MEWVEATGRTVTEAKDAALDLLGVAGDEADFEVIAEAEKGLFGRLKSEARVRARVRPTQPRPKVERERNRGGRNRGRSRNEKGGNKSGSGRDGQRSGGRGNNKSGSNQGGGRPHAEPKEKAAPVAAAAAAPSGGNGGGGNSNGGRGGGRNKRNDRASAAPGEGVSLVEQGVIVSDFMTGLVSAFGLEATSETVTVDEETIEIQVEGSDLGLLIGPKANTLRCVQELSRTVVQRQGDREQGRVRVDIGSYYADRRASLARFTTKVADQVRDSGEEVALEPMRAADRKVVHDTVSDLEGVDTVSEGSDPDRRVVIVPAR